MGRIDQLTNEYMSDNERFADVFNYFIYDGRQVIDAEKLHEMDTTNLTLPYGKSGASDAIQRYRDVLKSLTAMQDDRAAYLLLGIEDQTAVHYAMPVRNFLYDAAQYTKQVEAIAAAHKRNRKLGLEEQPGRGEFLSGFYKEDRLLPVITLVVYWSPDRWDGPQSIHEMLAIQNEEILAHVPDYRINLVSPNQMEDADFGKFRTSLAEAFQYIKYSADKNSLYRVVQSNQNFRTLDRRTAELINEVTGSKMKFENDKEDTNVCKAIEDMKKEAVEEALKSAEEANAAAMKAAVKEATATGKNKSIEQMLSKGRTPEAIADFCGYDIEEVRKVAENMSLPSYN
jgi:hypothetical protein